MATIETALHSSPALATERLQFSVRVMMGPGFTHGDYLSYMLTFIFWIILFVLCWPLAIVALVLYPIVWLLTLPFRLVGIAVDGVFSLLKALFMLPGKILRMGA